MSKRDSTPKGAIIDSILTEGGDLSLALRKSTRSENNTELQSQTQK